MDKSMGIPREVSRHRDKAHGATCARDRYVLLPKESYKPRGHPGLLIAEGFPDRIACEPIAGFGRPSR